MPPICRGVAVSVLRCVAPSVLASFRLVPLVLRLRRSRARERRAESAACPSLPAPAQQHLPLISPLHPADSHRLCRRRHAPVQRRCAPRRAALSNNAHAAVALAMTTPPPPPAPGAVALHEHFLGLSALHFGAFATGVVAFVLFGLTMARRCACVARDRRRALATRMRVLLEAVAHAEAAAAALRASGVPAWEAGAVIGAPLLAEPWPYVVGTPAAPLLPEAGPLVELLPLHGRCAAARAASRPGRGHCGGLTRARAGGAQEAARWGLTEPCERSAGVETRRAAASSCSAPKSEQWACRRQDCTLSTRASGAELATCAHSQTLQRRWARSKREHAACACSRALPTRH